MGHALLTANRPMLLACCVLAAGVLSAGAASADTIVANGFTYPHVQVQKYHDGQLDVQINGAVQSFPLAKVTKMSVSGATAFNKAEVLVATHKWKAAYHSYRQAIRHTNDRHFRTLVMLRAIRAADKAGHWLHAVRYFLHVLKRSPDQATLGFWPADIPPRTSHAVGHGASMLRQALTDSRLRAPAVQKGLKFLLLAVYNRQHSPRAAALAKTLGTKVPGYLKKTAVTAPIDVNQDVSVKAVRTALGRQQFAKAVKFANDGLANARGYAAAALYRLRGKAYEGLNKPQLAALSYLRAAFNFPHTPAAPAALYRAAILLKTRLHHPKEAAALFQQIKALYPKSKQAQMAQQQPARHFAARPRPTRETRMNRSYLVPFKAHRTAHLTTDILVVGGGVAGLRAALAGANHADVLVVTKSALSESNTYYAQGGIATVMGPEDSFDSHIRDTLAAGCGLCDPVAVETVVREAPARIDELIRWGANFDREIGGNLAFAREGGHSVARILHALGDATGKELANCLSAQVREHPAVDVLENTFVLDLLTLDNQCHGALAWRADRGLFAIFARRTVLASGGAGMLYRETTNPPIATADGHAMAARAGAVLRDMEMVQFHPTTIYIAGASRSLLSEAVRGEGATLIDKSGTRFMPEYHPAAELAPRDVVSRAIIAQMARTRTTNVYLDARHMSQAAFKARFPNIYQVCQSFGINPAEQPIPVHPSAHYMVGGVRTDLSGRSSVECLYAAGEAAYTGLHGANRLGSNSLIEALVFGARAGEHAGQEIAGRAGSTSAVRITSDVPASQRTELDTQDVRSSLRSLMWRNAGVERAGPRLAEASEIITFWSRYVLDKVFDAPAGWELQNMLTVAERITSAASARQETRGVHFRTDFPVLDDTNWRCHLDFPAGAHQPLKAPVAPG